MNTRLTGLAVALFGLLQTHSFAIIQYQVTDVTYIGYFDGNVTDSSPIDFDHSFSGNVSGNYGTRSMDYTGYVGAGYHSFSFTGGSEIQFAGASYSNTQIGGRVRGNSGDGGTYYDELTFTGSSTIDVEFSMDYDFFSSATTGEYGDFTITFNIFKISGSAGAVNETLTYQSDPDNVNPASQLLVSDVVTFQADPGDVFGAYYTFELNATGGNNSVGIDETEVSGTFDFFISSLSDGAGVTSTSGRDYLSAVPEPSTFAAITGLLALACVQLQRRKR